MFIQLPPRKTVVPLGFSWICFGRQRSGRTRFPSPRTTSSICWCQCPPRKSDHPSSRYSGGGKPSLGLSSQVGPCSFGRGDQLIRVSGPEWQKVWRKRGTPKNNWKTLWWLKRQSAEPRSWMLLAEVSFSARHFKLITQEPAHTLTLI